MNPAIKTSTLIELHVSDFKVVKEFYGELGFEVVRDETPLDKYLVMKLGENILCFWGGDERIYNHGYFKNFPKDSKRGYGIEIVIMVSELEKYYYRIKDQVKVVASLKLWPWGVKDFRIEDPNGFYLRFSEPHKVLDTRIT
jgi:lactoylglutathione lyase